MFSFVSLFLIILGAIPLLNALRFIGKVHGTELKRRVARGVVILGVVVGAIILLGIALSVYTEALWFGQLGFAARFWKVIWVQVLVFAAAGVISFVFVWSIQRLARMPRSPYGRPTGDGGWRIGFALAVGLLFGFAASQAWQSLLLALNAVDVNRPDPIFGRSLAFYLLRLPMIFIAVDWSMWLMGATVIVLGFGLGRAGGVGPQGISGRRVRSVVAVDRLLRVVLIPSALFFLLWAVRSALSRYELLYSTTGVVTGAGYTDARWRTLGYLVAAFVYGVIGLLLLTGAVSTRVRSAALGLRATRERVMVDARRPALLAGGAVVLVVVFQLVIPVIVQQFVVSPNEISLERPYIAHNIRYTREAYDIDTTVIREERVDVGREVSGRIAQANRGTLENVRLWDPRALMDNLREQQEIRLYYEFSDVDIDRYDIDGDYTQVMLSVRELALDQLDPRSQTWVGQHLKYTHGYGLVMLPVHEILPQGKPDFYIRGIPPRSVVPDLQVARPEIYYGERTETQVYVRTTEQEFDYPSGEDNVYTTYEGDGGVGVGSLWRRFLFALRFDDYRLLFSGYFTPESRVMFRRSIEERVSAVAPFLLLDRDPYAVLTDKGRIKFIIDAYTLSDRFPYSERYRGALRSFYGINYLRNSVKVVVDAYDGTVDLYVVEPDDPLVATYDRIFPGVFTPFEEMPDYLQDHIRYPADMLTIQAEMYSAYHMENPDVFYQREDMWAFATERYREGFQTVVPYYVMLNLPGISDDLTFSLITAFTPSNKNVIRAWMSGICDPPDYGKLLVLTYPKGIEVLGHRLIEARIDQDTEMSQAMTLWGQRGSEVIRGNLLAVPLFDRDTLYILYVEPIYLQAEDAQLPEIKRIVLADQTEVVWAPTFAEALERLTGEAAAREEPEGEARPEEAERRAAPSVSSELIEKAAGLLEEYRGLSGRGEYGAAGEKLKELTETLRELQSGDR